jgi:gliding motility-associated-like protein
MRNKLRYIFISILLAFAFHATAQYSIDKVCVGAIRHYRIDGEANSTYSWKLTDPSGAVTVLASTADTVEINWNVSPGIYHLSSVQHSLSNCDAVLEIGEIEVLNQPVAFAGNDVNSCSIDSLVLNQATAANYSDLNWTSSGDGYFNDPALLNPVYTMGVNDINSGSLVLTLTAQGLGNTNSCTPATSSLKVNISKLVLDSVQSTDATCGTNNGTITITASAGKGTLYSIDGGVNWSSSNLFTDLAKGSYIIMVKDSFCQVTYENNPVIVNTIGGPEITEVLATETTCNLDNGSITITAAGGIGTLLYSIDGGNTWSTNNTFIDLKSQNYFLRVKDDYCGLPYTYNPVSIGKHSLPKITGFQVQSILCYGAQDGIATANVSGGTQPYHYEWSSSSIPDTAIATGLSSGLYSLIVTDATGCVDSSSIFISQPATGITLTASINDNSCWNGNEGSITLTPLGGVQPYHYAWSDGHTTNSHNGLTTGSYNVIVSDANGCSLDTTFIIHAPETFTAASEIVTPVQTIGGTATVSVTATGGTAPYTGTGEYFVSAGTFTFSVTDSLGCEAITTINIPDAGKLLVADSTACLGDHITIPVDVFGFHDIAKFKLRIKYRTDILKCIGARYMDPGIRAGTYIYPDTVMGIISVSCKLDNPASIPDSGQLLVLEFITKAVGMSTITFDESIPGYNTFYNKDNHQIIVHYNQGKVGVIRAPIVDIIGETTIPAGQVIELNAMVWTGDPVLYQWITPSHDSQTGTSIKIDPAFEENSGVYVINVLDKNGCVTIDSALVKVGARPIMRIEVPSAFTPNGDGLNDQFLAYTNIESKFEFKMIVFNKWGQQIFESSDITKGWDGTYKGKPCASDLYTWVIYYGTPGYVDLQQKSPQKGVVMLVR